MRSCFYFCLFRFCLLNLNYFCTCQCLFHQLIGLDKSRLKIPMMDLASITYLPDTKSKSQSNLLISFTNAFTLSIEFSEIFNVFILRTSLFSVIMPFILPVPPRKVKGKRDEILVNLLPVCTKKQLK